MAGREVGHLLQLRQLQVVDDLVDELAGEDDDGGAPFRQGVVTDIDSDTTPPTYTATIAGGDVPGIASLIGGVLVGDSVYVIRNRGDWSIIGVQDQREWVGLALAAPWQVNSGSNALALSVWDRQLWLRGVVRAASAAASGAAIATLPPYAWPAADQQMTRSGGTSPYGNVRVDVTAGVLGLAPGQTLASGGVLFFDGSAPVALW